MLEIFVFFLHIVLLQKTWFLHWGRMDYRHERCVWFQTSISPSIIHSIMDFQGWINFLKIFVCVHLKKESKIHQEWYKGEEKVREFSF